MRRKEEYVYDFATDAWVAADAFNTRAEASDVAPLTPDVAPAPGKWTKLAPRGMDLPFATILLVWCAVGLAILSLVLLKSTLIVAASLCGVVAFAVYASRGFASLKLTAADRMLLEDPDDLDVCLVHLTIVRRGRISGTDKGVVWFAEGKLFFNGHRTSFAIGGEDVLPPSQWPFATSGERVEIPDHVVPLRVSEGTASVQLWPLSVGSGEMRFLKSLYAFRRRPPRSRGPRQWAALRTLVMTPDSDLLTYDFEADLWTEDAFVMVRRGEGERPAPEREPRPGRVVRPRKTEPTRASPVRDLGRGSRSGPPSPSSPCSSSAS